MATMRDTFFAPPERCAKAKFKDQIQCVSHSPIMDTLLKTMSGLLVVLNEDRQIVALNHAFLEAIGVSSAEEALGLRVGESLRCVHAHEKPHGCGTTPYCMTCGAAIAMMTAIVDDQTTEEICALTAEQDGVIRELCLLIRAQPIVLDGKRWILVFAQDITQQQFWVGLERVFFHDINNLLSPLLGNVDFLAMEMPGNHEVQMIREATLRMCGEISLQRSLCQQKNVKYLLRKSQTSLSEIRHDLGTILNGHEAVREKRIKEAGTEEDVKINTDRLLVSRVLGNMVINALEATEPGGEISIGAEVSPDVVTWRVWNQGHIDENVQKRVFQRHFSTKSKVGRGLGTYSMRLFGEKYLNGEVSFHSNLENGTTFTFRVSRS